MLKFTVPEYLKEAAKEKYGKGIYVVGATRDELQGFWSKFEKNAVKTDMPIEVGRTVVDIDAKSHINTGSEKSEDAYDSFKIISKAGSNQTKASSSSYQLQLSTTSETQIGANVNLKVKGPSFFNLASGGLTASHKESKTKTETWKDTEEESQSLSQSYEIVEHLQVPPRTKVRALVKTYAVTHKARTVVLFRVDANAAIPVRYRSWFSRHFMGGLAKKLGEITVTEIFRNESNVQVKDGILTFEREGSMSYLSEEVEVTKEEEKL